MEMKTVVFVHLNPYGNYVYENGTYVNGDSITVPVNIADSLIDAQLAIDPNDDPKFTKDILRQIKKDNERRHAILERSNKKNGGV